MRYSNAIGVAVGYLLRFARRVCPLLLVTFPGAACSSHEQLPRLLVNIDAEYQSLSYAEELEIVITPLEELGADESRAAYERTATLRGEDPDIELPTQIVLEGERDWLGPVMIQATLLSETDMVNSIEVIAAFLAGREEEIDLLFEDSCFLVDCDDEEIDRQLSCRAGECADRPVYHAGNYCGDGEREEEEACDEGRNNSNVRADACRLDCSPSRCGDGIRDSDELCDSEDPERCSEDCMSGECIFPSSFHDALSEVVLDERCTSVLIDGFDEGEILTVERPLTFSGPGQLRSSVIVRSDVRLEDVTVSAMPSDAEAAFILEAGTLEFDHVTCRSLAVNCIRMPSAESATTTTVTGSRFQDNTATAIVLEAGTITIQDTEFVNNTTTLEDGGAIRASPDAAVTVTGSLFTNNYAQNGGAIFGGGSFSACQFAGNIAGYETSEGGMGGAIHQNQMDLSLADCLFASNSAIAVTTEARGGALYVDGSLQAGNTIFSANKVFASGDFGARGSAVYVTDDCMLPIQFHNVVVADSEIDGSDVGGAIEIDQCSGVEVFSSTLAQNTSSSGTHAALTVSGSASVFVQNTILWETTGFACATESGQVRSRGYNLFSDVTSECTITGSEGPSGPIPVGDMSGADPLLSFVERIPLLMSASPAVNSGDPEGCDGPDGILDRDVRNRLRPIAGRCDIGAVERQVDDP